MNNNIPFYVLLVVSIVLFKLPCMQAQSGHDQSQWGISIQGGAYVPSFEAHGVRMKSFSISIVGGFYFLPEFPITGLHFGPQLNWKF